DTATDAPPARRLMGGDAIRLDAARGEHVGFEVAMSVEGKIAGDGFAVTRIADCGGAVDPLVPGDSGPGLFHVERFVPQDAAPGLLELKLTIAGDAVPVHLRVHKAVLPDALGFHVSLNAYGSPGGTLGDKPG